MRSREPFTSRKLIILLCLSFLFRAQAGYAQTQSQQPPPAPPKPAETKPVPAEERMESSDGQFSVALFYWLAPSHPILHNGGTANPGNAPANLSFPGKAKPTPGVILSFPAGDHHTLRVSYFRTQGHGNTVAASDLAIFSTGYSAGDYLAASYTLQSAKISLDYLSWPFPVKNSGLRVKTLWEVQYIAIRSAISAPLKPTTDSEGNSVDTSSSGTNSFIYPSLGMGLEHLVSRHFRWEAKATGFAIPHRPTLWDAEALGAYRQGQFEILFGGKAFHFRTSPRREEYMRATLAGAFVGVRWYPK